VFERVRADYVEKPDDSKLIESAINGMLAGLDPHSSYMDPKSFRDMQVETGGKFGGLGIEVTMEDGLIKVVAPIDGTPAAKAGILANDLITKLDDDQVQGMTLNQASLSASPSLPDFAAADNRTDRVIFLSISLLSWGRRFESYRGRHIFPMA
jgi:C-terminal processing protease CtpA/Prc